MGILHQLKSALLRARDQDPSTRDTLASIRQEGRLHARVKIPEAVGGFTQVAGCDRRGLLLNLSYGGMAIAAPPDEIDTLTANTEIDATVGILDQSHVFRVKLIRISPVDVDINLLGFSFIHNDSIGLLFLRRYIEPILEGGSLMLIPPEVRKDRYKSKGWLCFRGDRSTDLVIKVSPDNNQIDDLMLIFATQDGYKQLLYKSGVVSTARIDGPDSSLDLGTASVKSTAMLDATILRSAICLLASAVTPVAPLLSSFVLKLSKLNSSQP